MATPHDQAPQPPVAPSSAPRPDSRAQLVAYEQFIEDQLRKTRGQVRTVDIAGNLMLLAAGSLLFCLAAALVDHWIVPGGLGFWGRLLFFAGYLTAALYYLGTQVLPLLLRRINPVYAAHTIERSRPALKNALVNFLLFRASPGALNPRVYEAVEEQAATNLAKVEVETAVDRSKLIQVGYALVAIVLVCALYTLLSPKDLLRTVGRVAMPWADIGAPTRTAIDEITPGDTQAFRGQQVVVEARVQGPSDGGRVMLYYSTSDGQTIDRAVEMNVPPEGYRHRCTLPGGDASLQQDLTYRIEAGDAVTKRYRVEVVAAPTIVVQSVSYSYPSYTGLLASRVEHQGDIKAIEGTQVTLEAQANQPIDSAGVDFHCDGKADLAMTTNQLAARATFTLALKDDRQTPQYTSYQLLFKNDRGQQNPQPVRHQIEVVRDLPPEIQFVSPAKDEVDLPANGAMELEIVANDPDFALRLVKLSAARASGPLFDQLLLDEPWRGQFVKKYRLDAAKLGLKAGDAIDYWAMAEDTKNPAPNRTETAKRRIRIVSPGRQQPDQLADNRRPDEKNAQRKGDSQRGPADEAGRDGNGEPQDAPADQPGARQNPQKSDAAKPNDPQAAPADPDQPPGADPAKPQPGGEQGAGSAGKQAAGQQAAGKDGQTGGDKQAAGEKGGAQDKASEHRAEEHNVPSDGTDDGDAIEQILKHRDEQDQSAGGDKRSAAQKPNGKQENAGEQQAGDQSQQPEDQNGSGEQPQQPNKGGGQQRQDGEGEQQPGQPAGKSADKSDQKAAGQQPSGKAEQQGPEEPEGGDREAADKQPPGGEQGPGKQDAAGRDGRQGGDKRPDARPQQPSEKQPGGADQKQAAPPKKNQAGSGTGDEGDGTEGAGGDESEKDQAGQKGKSAKSSRQGQGQGTNPGDSGKNPDGKKSNQPGAGKGQAGDAPSDDDTKGDNGPREKNGKTGPGATAEKPTGDEPSSDEKNAPTDRDQRGGEKSPSKGSKPGGKPDAGAANEDSNQNAEGRPGDAPRDAKKSGGKKPTAKTDQPAQESAEAADADRPQGEAGDDGREGQQGTDGKSKGDTQPKAQPKPRGDSEQAGDPSADDKDKGNSGAGQKSQDKQGSPSPMNQNQARDKSDKASREEKNDQPKSTPSASASKQESNSEGQDSGDRSGGGKKGGGQQANKSGTGGPGQSTPSDEGAGSADEPGKGEDSNRPGADRQSDQKTGQSGAKPGPGSSGRATGGDQKGQGQQPKPDGPKSSAPDADRDARQPGDPTPDATGTPGAGTPGGGKASPPVQRKWEQGDEVADEANLDYARKAADLALSHLKDELGKDVPDPKLLERLGWSRQDAASFLARWEQMRKNSKAPGDKGTAARRELDETLRSLGLRPRATIIKSNASRDDQVKGLKESRRTTVPAEYEEQSKAYSQGTARGGR